MAAISGTHMDHYTSDKNSSGSPLGHTDTTIPSGQFDSNGFGNLEKVSYQDPGPIPSTNEKKGMVVDEEEEEEEDEDMDALIDDLASEDGVIHDDTDEKTEAGGARPVAEDLLQTSTTHGLTASEVLSRRKKFGPNQMKEEKHNILLIFLGFLVGPIQFVMEVCPCRFCFLQPSELSQIHESYLLHLIHE